MPDAPQQPIKPFRSRKAWETWLARNHDRVDGIWMKFAKKASGIPTVSYDDALEVALCYGWIDGQTRAFDDDWYLQRWTPRRKRSNWSKINREKATALIEAGKMQPAGLAQIEAARADGRWDAAYDSASTSTVPDDLQAALDANPAALTMFGTLSSRNRYAILLRISDAKKPETRARRIDKFVQMLADGQTIY